MAPPRAATVLVVEDNASLRDLYQKVLTPEGYRVITAADGLEALAFVDEQPVDAVVLDLVLPRLDGMGVKRAFNDHPVMRDVPVVLVTGHVAPDINRDEFNCVLEKPVSVEALLAAVRDCLAKSSAAPPPYT